MPEKPFKKSNFVGFDVQQPDKYLRDVDLDLRTLFRFSSDNPRMYEQSTEPTLADDTWAFWRDSDDSKFYLILRIGSVQKTVELT